MPPGYCTGELPLGRLWAGDMELWLKTSGPFSSPSRLPAVCQQLWFCASREDPGPLPPIPSQVLSPGSGCLSAHYPRPCPKVREEGRRASPASLDREPEPQPSPQGGADAARTLAFLPGRQGAAGLPSPAGAAPGPDGLPAPAGESLPALPLGRLHPPRTPGPMGNLLPSSPQLPFEELESQRGLPQLKSYLRQKLQALGLRWGPEGG